MKNPAKNMIESIESHGIRWIRTAWGLRICMIVASFALVVSAATYVFAVAQVGQERAVGGVEVDTENEKMIGPGQVRLTLTRDGRWSAFTPVWSNGRSLFSLGGVLVYARSADGGMTEVANTAVGRIRVNDRATRIRSCSEGASGGLRNPSPNPDDDRDGRVDEDYLDGVDNDNDGRVDEDFAAIGDEMLATCYFTPGDQGTGTQLAFHQEAYAWALPHIDGAVMMRLQIKNIGAESLEDIHLGTLISKDGPFYFSKWTVSLPGEEGVNRSDALVCEDLYGTSMGLVVFPGIEETSGSWGGGYVVGSPDAVSARVLEQLNETTPLSNEKTGLEPGDLGSSVSTGASVFKTSEIRVDETASIYGVSPNLGSLAPGEEIRVDFALFAVPEKTELEGTVINAFKTWFGDGTNHYLPPHVSMTRRVLWGSYRAIDTDSNGLLRVAVDIEALGDDPVHPDEISSLSGISPGAIDRVEIRPGVEQLVIGGETVQKSARKGERIILKGRLEDGEFFEVILRPEEGGASGPGPVEDSKQFWKTAGRLDLDMDLLSSSPNPFRDATTIYYEIPSVIEQEDGSRIETRESLEISVKVYNVVGRLVNMLVEEVVAPGVYSTSWQAVDEHGNAVASGVYYVRLQIEKKYITQRLILLK